MLAPAPVTALRIANEAFLVSSTIERCPKTMMLRELVANAIEAARGDDRDKRIEIGSVRIEGVPKLCIRNTGRGMSVDELDRICDLASSLFKENGLDANFGMGAKVASLPSNKHGLRYRSCKDGVVSEVILCQRDGIYGRLRRSEDGSVGGSEVVDSTAAARAEGRYDLSSDWTEVVLYGNSANQNTVSDPYGGNPRVEPDWLIKGLTLRFFRIPPGITLNVGADAAGSGRPGPLATLGDLGSAHATVESLRTPSGITLHYRHDPAGAATRETGALAGMGGLGCIVYKDEIYDPRTGSRWSLDAPTFGIAFGARFFSVFVELPDDYLVRPEAYRQFLRFRGGDQRQVFLQDFGQLVTAYLPGWMKALIRGYGPRQAQFVADVEDELRALVEELGIEGEFKPLPAPPAKPAAPPTTDKTAPAPPDRPQTEKTATKPRPAPVPPKKRWEKPPEIIGLDSEELIEERGLAGRAAKFYPASRQLFVNLKYPTVQIVADQLEAHFANAADRERMRAVARGVAGWTITRRIARAVVYSLSKSAAGWPAEDVRRAQSPECLSLVADDIAATFEAARQRMQEELGAGWENGAAALSIEPHMQAETA